MLMEVGGGKLWLWWLLSPHSVCSQRLCHCEGHVGWQQSRGGYSPIFSIPAVHCDIVLFYDFCVSSHYALLFCCVSQTSSLVFRSQNCPKIHNIIIISCFPKILKHIFLFAPLQNIHLWAETIKCGKTPAGTNTGTTGGIQTADSLYNNSFS